MENMKNTLYVKGFAIAIAAAFLLMAGNGLTLGKSDGGKVNLESAALSVALDRPQIDLERLRGKQAEAMSAPPVETPKSIAFEDSFEDDILGELPDSPPWVATEKVSTASGHWGPDDIEDDTVGQNPGEPWKTVDGTTIPASWGVQTFESYTPAGTPIGAGAFTGNDGYFWSMAGTLVSSTNVGNPASVMGGHLSGGALSADLTASCSASYFGPVFTNMPDYAYMGGWFLQKQLTTNCVLQVMAYDLVTGDAPCVVAMYPYGTPIEGRYVAFDPDGGWLMTPTWTINTWHELFMEIDIANQEYTFWIDGTNVGTFAFVFPTTNIDGFVIYAAANTGMRCDNPMIGLPPTGGAHAVSVSNAWSCSIDGGGKSIYMDQNAFAGEKASVSVMLPPPYAYGVYAGFSWYMRTSTTIANTNGATFRLLDFNERTLMALRFSGGQIQYQTSSSWVNAQAFTANTEYFIALYMDGFEKTYSGLYIDDTEYVLLGEPLVNPGAGVAGFVAEGTVSTQSEIYIDYVEMFGDQEDGTVRITDFKAHTGTQSARLWEANADEYEALAAYLGGDGCAYGDLWFNFYGDGTLGGGVVYIYDTTDTFLVTILSLGGDLSAANIPSPGQVSWVDGDGAGGGWIIDGPTITPNTWNNISIRYNVNTLTFEARWNGVLQGTFGFLDSGALDAGVVYFFGEGPAAPCDWFFDDIGLWVDDVPLPASNVRTYLPDPMPSNEAWYLTDLDSAVEGTVTGTYANTAAVDAITQNVQEAFVAGSSTATTYSYTTYGAGNKQGYAKNVNNGAFTATNFDMAGTGGYTELTAAEYGNIAVIDDGSVWEYDNANAKYWRYHVHINEAEGSIADIDALWDASAFEAANAATLYIWDDTAATWIQLATGTPAAGGPLQLTGSPAGTMADYVDSGGYVYLGIRVVDPGAQARWVRTDYVNVTIFTSIPDSYSLEHRWRTVNVPTGASVMELSVTARTNSGADDTFSFGYSTVLGGPYTPTITVNSATMATYSAAIPVMSGQFYINVIDNNGADTAQDTVYVDAISIYWQEIIGITNQNEVATADNPVTGTVTGDYTRTTPIVPDGTAQQIAEVSLGSQTFINEAFAGGVPPTGWNIQLEGTTGTWGSSSTANAGGTAPEARFSYGPSGSGFGRLYAGPFDTNGFTTLTLQFRHLLDTYAAGCTLRVQTSTDALTWTNTGWSVASGTVNVGPALVTEVLDATENVGSSTLYVAWVVADNSYQIDYWYVDNCLLSGTPSGFFATHRYTMQNMPLNTISNTLAVHARTSAVDEAFNIGYASSLAGPYTDIISVASTTYTTYTAPIPAMFDGPMYIQVKDALSGTGDTASTSIYIDSLYVATTISPVNTTVNVVWDLSGDDGAGFDDLVQYNVYYSDQETSGTYAGPFNYLGSSPAGSNMFRHYGEAADIVNNIWYYVRAADAHAESTPTGVASKFNLAPDVTTAMVDSLPGVEITQGTAGVSLFAVVYDDSSTWENIPKLDGAEFYVDTDPGEGMGTVMWDMGLGTSTVQFNYNLDTSLWGAGNYTIYMRGHESGPGNTGLGWGVAATVWINIVAGEPELPYDINLGGHLPGEWVFVSFPIAVSGNILDILDDTIIGDGFTAWDVARWYNPQDMADHWKIFRVGGTSNDLATMDNTMGVWLHLIANGGDQMLTTSLAGYYPSGEVVINLYSGWNMVGYPSATPNQPLPGVADIVSIWQSASPYIMDAVPGTVNMTHGNAYWIHVTSDTTWTLSP
jgi:hypothetical protein